MRATTLPPGALLSSAEWRELGVSSKRLAGDDLVRVFPGYRTPRGAPATVNEMCRVLQQRVLPGAVISHTTAALLYGIPIPWKVDRRIGLLTMGADRDSGVLTIPSTMPVDAKQDGGGAPDARAEPLTRDSGPSDGQRDTGPRLVAPSNRYKPLAQPPLLHCRVDSSSTHRAGPHVKAHRKAEAATFEFGGLRMSHPFVVLLELATMLKHDELVIALDAFERRRPKPPLSRVTLAHVTRNVGAYSGLPGAPALRRALRDARPNTDSPGETLTRLLIRRAGFPEPTLNLPVTDPDSSQTRYIDLSYPEQLIGVEYDGDIHRVSKEQWREDRSRQDSLESIGWNIRRLNALDITGPARFLSALRRAFLAAGADAPPESNWTGAALTRLTSRVR